MMSTPVSMSTAPVRAGLPGSVIESVSCRGTIRRFLDNAAGTDNDLEPAAVILPHNVAATVVDHRAVGQPAAHGEMVLVRGRAEPGEYGTARRYVPKGNRSSADLNG